MARINKSGTELPAESKVDQENDFEKIIELLGLSLYTEWRTTLINLRSTVTKSTSDDY